MADSFIDNAEQHRFEYHTNGAVAFADYRREGTTLFIDYVEAPPQLRGTGAAGKLMQHIVETAQKQELNITPICGYAASWLTRHTHHISPR
jgi:uncharacterized protein